MLAIFGGENMEDQEIQAIKIKKRILKRYRINRSCIERLEDKLYLLEQRLQSVKSPGFSDMPRGNGSPITTEELILDKLDLEKRIKRLKNKSVKIRDQLLEAIDSLEDPRYCEVLESYFIECKTIEDIALDMGYNDRYIYDLYRKAIIEINLGTAAE